MLCQSCTTDKAAMLTSGPHPLPTHHVVQSGFNLRLLFKQWQQRFGIEYTAAEVSEYARAWLPAGPSLDHISWYTSCGSPLVVWPAQLIESCCWLAKMMKACYAAQPCRLPHLVCGLLCHTRPTYGVDVCVVPVPTTPALDAW